MSKRPRIPETRKGPGDTRLEREEFEARSDEMSRTFRMTALAAALLARRIVDLRANPPPPIRAGPPPK